MHVIKRSKTKEELVDEEAEHYYNLRLKEQSILSAIAFDEHIKNTKSTSIDLMWALSYHESAKQIAKIGLRVILGEVVNIGKGMACEKCNSRNTIARPVQTNSGDEPTKLFIECLNPLCKFTRILG